MNSNQQNVFSTYFGCYFTVFNLKKEKYNKTKQTLKFMRKNIIMVFAPIKCICRFNACESHVEKDTSHK